MSTFLRRSSVAVAAVVLLAGAACTVHKSETPALTGPSEFGLSVVVTAIPDSIKQDGASQSAIVASVHDASGQPKAGVSLRADISVGGVIQDFGQLTAKALVTGGDGKASTIYTAPAAAPGAGFSTVSIVVTPIGSDFQAAVPQTVSIRLSPPGVVQPATATPLARFVVTPASPNANILATFDGTSSCPSTDNSGACTTTGKVVSYAWDFGDGATASGIVATHAFAVQQVYSVALTVTNDKGATNTGRQTITVNAPALPIAAFTFAPAAPAVGDNIFFDATTSTAGAGHVLKSYQWTADDGASGTGLTVSHAFLTSGNHAVTLKVTDEAGQISTKAQVIPVAGTASIVATFIFSPTDPFAADTIFFDASNSTSTSLPVTYSWDFGDGVTCTSSSGSCQVGGSGSAQKPRHVYGGAAHTWEVTLTVTDAAGRIATTKQDVKTK